MRESAIALIDLHERLDRESNMIFYSAFCSPTCCLELQSAETSLA
ncbi:hypothetical protein HMPREF1572_01396 [Gardnerella vaginalis JCP7275]|nr:hypothetical protein HMPREF1572_01396 [Gardnerella vaginalis JCP7275]